MKKILIVSSLRQLIEKEKNILNRSDFKIFTASSGEAALNIHRTEKMDMIIADLDMPGMSGDKICAAIRAGETIKKVSIILVCSNKKSDLERCTSCGANSYITNPIDSAGLVEKAVKLLNISERKSYRVLIKVEVKGKFMNVPFFCSSQNLSASGMLLETEKPLAAGDTMSLSFFLPNSERIAAEGKVVRVIRKAVKTFQYGVKFVNLSPESISSIETFVKSWHAEQKY